MKKDLLGSHQFFETIISFFVPVFLLTNADKFPIHKFYNVTQRSVRSDLSQFLCSNSQYQSPFLCCSCDDDCMKYKSCCINKFWNRNNNSAADLKEYVNNFIDISNTYKTLHCEELLPNVKAIFRKKYFLMVTTCADDASITDKELCGSTTKKSFRNTLPVLGTDGYLYRNEYCAKCNNVQEFNHLNISGYCETRNSNGNASNESLFGEFQNCSLTIKGVEYIKEIKACRPKPKEKITAPPNYYSMYSNTIRNCESDNPYYDLCNSHAGLISGGHIANYFCSKCQNISSNVDLSQICFKIDPGDPAYGWSIVISSSKVEISFINDKSAAPYEHRLCKKDKEQYDIFTDECQNSTCPNGYSKVKDRCLKTKQTSGENKSDKNNNWLDTVNNVQYYTSIVGSSVSIVCYVCIIATFLIYTELQNLPGMNTIALCCSLLIADASFIIGVENRSNSNICKTFAIILHWSLLLVAVWLIIIAFDLMIRFSKVKPIPKGRHVKQFFKYCIVALSLPTVIIVITIALDESDSVDIGYGDHKKCLINNIDAYLVSFMAPIAFCYLLTITTLCYTIHKLYFTTKSNAKVLSENGKVKLDILKIVLKRSCVLGIIEGIGFVQIHGDDLTENQLIFNSVFGTLFAIFRSLRGLILLLVYIVKKDIFALYKKSLKIKAGVESNA